MKKEQQEEIVSSNLFYYQISEVEELEVVVYFTEETFGVVVPKCAGCGFKMEEEPAFRIGSVIKVVDTTDTTNTPADFEKLIEEDDKHFNGIIAKAQDVLRWQQEHPDKDVYMCKACTKKEIMILDAQELEEATVYKPRN